MLLTDKSFYESQYGLPIEEADGLGISFLTPSETDALEPHYYKARSMKIVYPKLTGELSDFHRVRYLDLSEIQKIKSKDMGGFTPSKSNKSVMKYHQPSGHEPMLYFSTYIKWDEVVKDTKIPLILTEGEMKANAVCKHNIPTISMGGVWNWSSKKTGVISDFDSIDWNGRPVLIVFDSDIATKPQVKHAMYRLCTALTSLGAKIKYGGVYHPDLEDDPKLKLGLDDYLRRYGKMELAEFLFKSKHLQDFSMSASLHKYNSEFAYIQRKIRVLEFSSGEMMKGTEFTGIHKSNEYIMVPKDPSDPESKLVRKKLANEWLGWPQRMELEDIVYKPGQEKLIDNKYYNYWDGWAHEPIEGDTSMYDEYLDHVFGTADDAREWYESWVAYQFQNPGVKLYTAVVLWSPENGSGKTLAGYIIREVMGRKNTAIIDNDTLKSDYSGHLKHTQFVLADEILSTSGNKRAAYDKLKGLITNEESTVNIKFQPQYQIDDVTNYLFTSNHPDAFYLDKEDRRFFIWCIENGVLDEDWAAKFEKWWKSKEGASALMHRWQTKDIKAFNPKGKAMGTSYKDQMVETSQTEVEQWLTRLHDAVTSDPQNVEWIDNNMINGPTKITSDLLTGNDLYNLCKEARSKGMGLSTFVGKLGTLKLPKFNKGNQVLLGKYGKHRFYIIRNVDKWLKTSLQDGKDYLMDQANKEQILFKSYGDFSSHI